MFSFFVATTVLATGSVSAGTIDENKALVSSFIVAENTKDYETLPTYITDDFKRHSESSPNVVVVNKNQFIAHMRDGDAMFLDTKIHAQQMIAEGDRVAVWASYRGSVAGSGVDPKIDVDISMIFRIEGDNIAELWVMWDNNALRSQLKANNDGAKSNH